MRKMAEKTFEGTASVVDEEIGREYGFSQNSGLEMMDYSI